MAKKLSRLAKLGGLTSKVSSSYVGQRIKGVFQTDKEQKDALQRLHIENAKRIAEAMGVLKGAAMKVGQSVAVIADSMDLPEDVSRIFSKLQDRAEPIPFATIEKVLRREYGDSYKKIFVRIDPEPLGTASLAQAHAAWLEDGQAVVIKVLHEGVEDSVDVDLTALKTILISGRFLKRSREEIDLIFDEIRLRLLEELDYQREAENLRAFHVFFQDRPEISIPLPVDELCRPSVLVMQRLLGKNLDQFLATATPQARQRAGEGLTYVFHEMAYVFRALHADPHGGNYLFKEDGTVGLIDFGCVKILPSDFMASYARCSNALIDLRKEEMLHIAEEMELMKNPSHEAKEALWAFSLVLRAPFQGEYQCGVDEDRLMHNIQAVVPEILRYQEIRTSRDIIFLHRTLTGIYSMLCRLQHRCDYEVIRRRYAQNAIDVFEGRTEDRAWK